MSARRRMILPVLALFAVALLGCNAFESLGDKNSRDAKLEEARIAIDRGDFAAAVAILEPLSAGNPGDAEIARTLASAYAGRAGLDFLSLASRAAAARDNASLSTIGELIKTLPPAVDNGNLADIAASISLLRTISSASGEQNDFYALSMAELTQGLLVTLSGTDSDHDGVPDAFSQTAISDGNADLVYESLSDAIVQLGPGKAGLAADSDVLDALGKIKAGIDATTGHGSFDDNLRYYLQQQLGGAG